MKLIQVTSSKKNQPIYINIDMIGHINICEIKGRVVTNIGVTTHNGGFFVIENVERVISKIKKANGVIEKIKK